MVIKNLIFPTLCHPLHAYLFITEANKFVNKCYSWASKPQYDGLNPYFVTGFSDAESYFLIVITKSKDVKTGWSVSLRFGINLHKDEALLKSIQQFFVLRRNRFNYKT